MNICNSKFSQIIPKLKQFHFPILYKIWLFSKKFRLIKWSKMLIFFIMVKSKLMSLVVLFSKKIPLYSATFSWCKKAFIAYLAPIIKSPHSEGFYFFFAKRLPKKHNRNNVYSANTITLHIMHNAIFIPLYSDFSIYVRI